MAGLKPYSLNHSSPDLKVGVIRFCESAFRKAQRQPIPIRCFTSFSMTILDWHFVILTKGKDLLISGIVNFTYNIVKQKHSFFEMPFYKTIYLLELPEIFLQ